MKNFSGLSAFSALSALPTLSLLLLIALILTIFGCGQKSTEPNISNTEPIVQEIPADIEKIMGEFSFDGLNNSKGMALSIPLDIVTGDDADGEWDIYAVTFLWGQFFGIPSNVAVKTDWTGNLMVNGVADIKVFHEIDFEHDQDYLVDVDNEAMVKWVSITNGDFDGLSFIVKIKRGIEYFAPLYLSFDTEPFQLRLPIEKLRMFKGFYNVDNSNGVAVFAHKIWREKCPRGMMKGHWIKEDIAGNKGHMRGLWLEDNRDQPAGYFVGQFWTDENGNRYMEGSVSGYITDQVIAFFKGRWYYDDFRECAICGSGHGKFHGRFEYADRDGWGYLSGTFGWGTSLDALELPLEGVWKKRCPTISNTDGWD